MDNLPELLAPAGDWNSLVAAIQNGANAVYLGTTRFSARQDAANFTLQQLGEAVPYAHSRGSRIYVAVNTLIAEPEMSDALRLAENLVHVGIDGLIVQDIGLAANLRLFFPELPLHASTQMTVHNAAGVDFLTELGFTRVVLARELALKEIAAIVSRSSLEIEVFVHGAMCFSYSGDCLLSSMIGGRSGNRGRCAQPCRMEYALVNSDGRVVEESGSASRGPYLLSPKDLNTLEHLPDLVKAGIRSLKIEGRLKRPEYVAMVVKAYRKALDHLRYDENPGSIDLSREQAEVEQVFNRGFSTGYLYGNPGRDLMSYNKSSNRGRLLGKVKKVSKALIWVELETACAVGDGYELWMSDNGRAGDTIRYLFRKDSHGGLIKIQAAEPGQLVGLEFDGPAAVGDPVYKNRETSLLQQAGSTFRSEHENLEIPVTLRVVAKIGSPCEITFCDPSHLCGVGRTEFIVEKARRYALSEEDLLRQVNRLGNTPFVIKEHVFELDPEIMVPKSELNEARRIAINNLLKARSTYYAPVRLVNREQQPLVRQYSDCLDQQRRQAIEAPQISVVVDSRSGLETVLTSGADLVYLADTGFSRSGQTFDTADEILSAFKLCRDYGKSGVFLVPPIVSDSQLTRYQQLIAQLQSAGEPIEVGVADFGVLNQVRQLNIPFRIEPQLNTFNSASVSFFSCIGANQIHLSPEVNLEQLQEICQAAGVPQEIMVHGHQVVMISEHCVLGSVVGGITAATRCHAPCHTGESFGLKDRLGKVFPMRMDRHCRMYLFNSVELCLIEHLREIRRAGVSRLRIEGRLYRPDQLNGIIRRYLEGWHLVCSEKEDSVSVKEVLGQYRRELEPPTGITKGHLFRGVV